MEGARTEHRIKGKRVVKRSWESWKGLADPVKELDFYYISKESHRSDPWRDRTEGESGRNFGKFILAA